jgi:hypothetical protein
MTAQCNSFKHDTRPNLLSSRYIITWFKMVKADGIEQIFAEENDLTRAADSRISSVRNH